VSGRQHNTRVGRSIRPDRLGSTERAIGRLLYPEAMGHWRPTTRADCASVPRPCPYVGCKWNLYLDVTPCGSIAFRDPGIEPWDVPPEESCALDVADRGGETLADIGRMISVSRERARQLGEAGRRRAQEAPEAERWRKAAGDG